MCQYERMGVFEKWPKIKSVLERGLKFQCATDYYIQQLHQYVTREDALPNHFPGQNISNSLPDDYAESLGRYQSETLLLNALKQEPWLPELTKWNLYYQVGLMQDFFWSYQFSINWPNHPNGGRQAYSFQYASNMMAITSLLGWKDAVIQQGYTTIAALNRSYQLVLEYQDEHRRAQAFMLRLFCDWVGDVSHRWPSYAYDEPIYEALIQHWRTPNPEDLVPCLLAACDRHTHQTGRDSSKNFYDFSIPALMRVPIEILFLFRLREWEGLTNPTLDHPLMAAPFDKLPEVQPIPAMDELIQGVLKRAREDWPNYDEVIALDNLKK